MIYQRAKYNYAFQQALRAPVVSGSTSVAVSVANSSKLSLGTGDFAIACWIYQVSSDFNGSFFFLKRGSDVLGIECASASNKVYINIRPQGGGLYQYTYNRTNLNGQWQHILFQRKGGTAANNQLASNYELWINGTLQTLTSGSNLPNANIDTTGAVQLHSNSGSDIFFDEYSVYKGTFFTASEVAEIYNNGLGAEPPMSKWANLVLYLTFDHRNGRTVADRSAAYNPSIANTNGSVSTNITDAQLGITSQATNTCWVDHFTRNPITT